MTRNWLPYNSFNYWFEPSGIDTYYVYNNAGERCGELIENRQSAETGDNSSCINFTSETISEADQTEIIKTDFNNYKHRPEYTVGHIVDITGAPLYDQIDNLIEEFELRLLGVYLIRWYQMIHSDIDKYIDSFESNCLSWLRSTDLYTAPSSTKYHDACKHGLLYHSLKVYNLAIEFMNCASFKQIDVVSTTVVSLTHDFCKIGLYESYLKNVKDQNTGEWTQVEAYRHKKHIIPLGHGVSSVYLASRFFNLSLEESLAIRWHMSQWSVAPGEDAEMAQACDTYPLVQLIQFADQLSTRDYAVWTL